MGYVGALGSRRTLRTSLPVLDATSAEATTIGLVVVAMLAVSALLARRSIVSPVYGGQPVRLLLALLWSANLAFFAAATLRVWLDLPYRVVAGAAVARLVFGVLAYWRTADIGPMQLYTSAVTLPP
ncbi:hypothetical protein [Parafrankia discariae]|uniref:hypothetical protein n=1 Tax=Parafrankia discariae TaxID=365528 RepID=UPI0003A2878E|nr:hypothetical protein [Parafrankia discariae]